MKKIMILLALVASMHVANAQKSPDSIRKAVEAAELACKDEKKASKVATWLTYAKAATEAFTAPQLSGWVGGSRQELQMVMGNQRPMSSEQVTINGTNYTVDTYYSCKYYYGENGTLQAIETTRPYIEDALGKAVYAYENAAKVDPKGTKTKDICDGLAKVAEYYQSEAMTAYTLGDLALASKYFQKAYEAGNTEPLAKGDVQYIYNSGLTASMAGDNATCKTAMLKCIELNYLEDGEVFAKLAECEKNLGDTLACKKVLEEGFAQCPNNQGILVGLINLYLDTNDDPEKLFSLLEVAKKNEPNNASLYYVEGNIRKQLGQTDAAVAAYSKCAEVNPEYEFGYVGAGLLYWEESMKISEEAEKEFDDAKYAVLVEKFDAARKAAIPHFKAAFELTKDAGIKVSIADYLKNIYFRYRDNSDAEKEAYEFYNDYVKNN